MKRAPLELFVLLALAAVSALELADWAGEAAGRDHVAPVVSVLGAPVSTELSASLERALGELSTAAALALEEIPAGSEIFVFRTTGPSRDGFKKARALSIALRALLSPSQAAPLRGLPGDPPASDQKEVWLLQLDRADLPALDAWGMRVVAERPGVRLWVYEVDT